jgi:hypothetical protein
MRLFFTTDAIAIAVKSMHIGTGDSEVSFRNLTTVAIGRRVFNADIIGLMLPWA